MVIMNNFESLDGNEFARFCFGFGSNLKKKKREPNKKKDTSFTYTYIFLCLQLIYTCISPQSPTHCLGCKV